MFYLSVHSLCFLDEVVKENGNRVLVEQFNYFLDESPVVITL